MYYFQEYPTIILTYLTKCNIIAPYIVDILCLFFQLFMGVLLMDTKNLITFVTFAKEKSYLKTSMQLHYAPSTLIEHIAQLEQELSIKLVETVGRKTVLTKQGKQFLPYASNILESVRIAKDAMDNTQSLKGTITIGIIESMAAYKMSSVFSEFLGYHPNVNLIIKTGNSASLPEQLRNGNFDVVFLYDCLSPIYEGLFQHLLFQERLQFCVSPGHRLAFKDEVLPVDFRHETFLYQHEDCCYYDIFQELIQKENLKIRDRLQIDSGILIKKYVAKGKGISILPKSMTDEDVLDGKLVYLNWVGEEMKINGRMLTSREQWKPAAVQTFIEFAKNYLYQN